MPCRSRISLLLLLLAYAGSPSVAVAAPIVRGYALVSWEEGVALYRHRRDYVQVITPSQGARLHLLHGEVLEQGDHATFPRKSVAAWWAEWTATTPRAFSLVNGQFFNPADASASALAFSMKSDGKVYEGYADATEYRGKKRVLLLWPDRHAIVSYNDSPAMLRDISAPDILVGLDPRASKAGDRVVPRTFIGIAHTGETLIFSSSSATQNYAARVLRQFGADARKIIMFDGGNSSHLVRGGKTLVPVDPRGGERPSRELLPQAIGIEAGPDAVGDR